MRESTTHKPTRRGFLGAAVALVGVPLMAPQLDAAPAVAVPAEGPLVDRPSGYRSLTPEEAAFTEHMVNALCPADHITPDGVTCGLALFIDRQLDGELGGRCAQGAWEHGEAQSYSQLPLTQEQFFKAGVASVDAVCQQRFGVRFSDLAAPVAVELLRDIAVGRVVATELPLAAWYSQLVDPLLVRASFSGPVHDEHLSKVFWKLFVASGESA